jgi:hypothetical protein
MKYDVSELYKVNATLIIPFFVVYAVLSILLPFHSNNTSFHASGILFLISILVIPIDKTITEKYGNKFLVVDKIHTFLEFAHIFTLIAAIISFSSWILNLWCL